MCVDVIFCISDCSDAAQFPLQVNSASFNGDQEEDTSGYLSDTRNNTISSPEIASEQQSRRINGNTVFKPGRTVVSNSDFSEIQYAMYNRKPLSSSSNVATNSTNPGTRVRQYFEENGGNFEIPPGYQKQVERSVKSRSTFAGDEIDLDLETDFSVPK